MVLQILSLRKIINIGKAGETTNVIYVSPTKVTEAISNAKIEVKMPVTTGNQGVKDSGTKIYDLKRFDHKFTINGFLEAQDFDGDGKIESAKQVKDYLYNKIFLTKGDILLLYREQADANYNSKAVDLTDHDATYVHCSLNSVSFTDSATVIQSISGVVSSDEAAANSSPRKYEITLELRRGLSR